MIKSVIGSRNIVVNQSGSMPYINPGVPSSGMVRYSSNMQHIEVYDGSTWQSMSGYADVGLAPEADLAIEWAKKKMRQETRIDELCKKYPGLGKARDNYETFLRLVESEASISSS